MDKLSLCWLGGKCYGCEIRPSESLWSEQFKAQRKTQSQTPNSFPHSARLWLQMSSGTLGGILVYFEPSQMQSLQASIIIGQEYSTLPSLVNSGFGNDGFGDGFDQFSSGPPAPPKSEFSTSPEAKLKTLVSKGSTEEDAKVWADLDILGW